MPCSTGRIDYIHETGELTGTLLFKFMLSDTEGNDLIDQDFFITVMGKSCPIPSCLVSSCLVLPIFSSAPSPCHVLSQTGFVVFCLMVSVIACRQASIVLSGLWLCGPLVICDTEMQGLVNWTRICLYITDSVHILSFCEIVPNCCCILRAA